MKRTFLLVSALAFMAAPRGNEAYGQTARFELSNSRISIALDQDGRLIELKNQETGHNYIKGPARPPWRMYYRLNGPMDGALDLEISPDGQKGAVRREGSTLTLSYQTLQANLPRGGRQRELQVGLTVRVALDGDQLVWTGAIENRERDPGLEITELWIPWIYGVGHLGLGRSSDVLYWPERAGRRIQDPYGKLTAPAATSAATPGRGESPSYQTTYPAPAAMQWFTLNNGMEGLYAGSHDKSLMTTCLSVMSHARDEALSLVIVKYPFVRAGETWTSEPVIVRPYRGDWHMAARHYRAWTDTWMKKPNPPQWLRQTPGWVLSNWKGQSGHINTVYAELPDQLKQARSVGIDLMQIFGWAKQGFDNLYPEYETDEAMGGAEGLKQAIAEVRQSGGRTILYTQGQLIDPSTEFYKTQGRRIVARDIWGYEYRESYGGGGQGTLLSAMRNKYFGVACPGAAGWYERLLKQYEMVRGFGAQGILFDQMGGRPPYICFSKEHPHAKPSLAAGPGKVANMKRLRAAMKPADPDFAFVIELATDCYFEYVDIIHSNGIGFWPEPEAFGEMLRYTFPEPLITNRGGGTSDRRAQLGYTFTLGWRFDSNLRDVRDAGLHAYLARLTELRRKYSDLLLEGRFVDNEGFLCDNSRVASHAFTAGNRMAVTLWNPTETAQRAKVIAPGYVLEEVQWQDPQLTGADQALRAGEVALLVFRHQ
jgi:hypothetical protein